jgi:hypothetical protein
MIDDINYRGLVAPVKGDRSGDDGKGKVILAPVLSGL